MNLRLYTLVSTRYASKIILFLFFTMIFYAGAKSTFGVTPPLDQPRPVPAVDTTKVSKDSTTKTFVYLERADSLVFDEATTRNANLFLGNVCFRHDSAYMYCDSAYFFEAQNSLEAYGNVRIVQGDTLFVYGDYLLYDGNTQLAQIRENVKMENRNVTLLTDSLDYDRAANIAYYFEGGVIADSGNVLTSRRGTYFPATKETLFEENVKLENDKFVLTTDSLQYNTSTSIATFIAFTNIVSDSSVINTTNGWYNTQSEYSVLLDRSEVWNKHRKVVGDSLVYDKQVGKAEVFGRVEMRDTTENMALFGEYAFFDEKTEYSFITDSALFIQYGKEDTLYLHADSLKSLPDSIFKIVRAYKQVRFYRTSGQGVCDSMEFFTRDSMLHMYTSPVLWSGENQLTGDTISALMNDSTIQYAHIRPFAFSVQQVDSLCFNQLSGKDMMVYFNDGELERIDLNGNVETIFYPLEEDSTMIGLNRAVSSFLTMYMKNQKLERLKMWPNIEGSLTPLLKIVDENRHLKGFNWYNEIRPTGPEDVFRKPKQVVAPTEERRVRKRR
ncbi:MAG: OstA-like protein [Bacteroidales bacterium]